MHTLTNQTGGWTLETLADDSDEPNRQPTLEKELQGCCSLKQVKESPKYVCLIRYEELRHNELIYVEAMVIKQQRENTEDDIEFFRRRKFEGNQCKKDAAVYVSHLKIFVDDNYFR